MSSALDPAFLEILWTRLISIVDEAAATFVRSSFSTLAREANDFAVVLTDDQGRSIAQSSISVPSFIGTLPATVRHFLEHFPPESLREGDVLITNDPWKGTGHVHDVTVVSPIMRNGRLIAFAAITSHMPDIGGRLRNSGIREIYEEGLQIPLLKLVESGRVNEVVVDFIRSNVRVPEATVGDIWGEVAACVKVSERLHELLDEADFDLVRLSAEIRSRSESAMRAGIRELEEGCYRYVLTHDGFEERITIMCAVTVRDGAIHVDYDGTSSQLPRAVNVVPIYTFAYTAYGVKTVLCPDVPNNDGSFVPISTSAPEGSILNPRYPAPGGARNMIGHLLPAAFMGAIAEIAPQKVWAAGTSNSSLTIAGEHGGKRYAGLFFVNGGQGGSHRRPGLSALCFPSNLANTPLELVERTVPVEVEYRQLRKGSGGSGTHAGGDGLEMAFRFVGDTPATCSFIVTRIKVAAPGLLGGEAGAVSRVLVNDAEIDPSEHVILRNGDRVVIQTAGGGGFGRVGSGE